MGVEAIIGRCQGLLEDLDLACVSEWKAAGEGRKAIGFLPVYVPRELIHAAGALPVGILGAGEELEIVRGDACFQSYICHIPRSTVELGLRGKLDALDGALFPSTCDVIRNLSGIWQLMFPEKEAIYFDVPQNLDPQVGGVFYRGLLAEIVTRLQRVVGRDVGADDLRAAISAYNASRRLVRELYDLRAAEPWRVPTSEAYLLLRAGMRLPVEEHNELLANYLTAVRDEDRALRDNARIVITGTFCEQPSLDLIRTLEHAGCYVVDDDLMLVTRWYGPDIRTDGDPLDAIAEAWMSADDETPCRYVADGTRKGQQLVDSVRRCGAEGVIFAAPSFCDPALLDRPMLQAVLEEEGIAYTSFKYSENTAQLQPIREQAGTFADTIKLWSDA
ncbi:MAG: benzoyl-CoA reductase subunit C [Planctomycetota bacterium]|jgi:benzoyl-CoA reductase subunit C|nr:benzoyl-CoA reductase subunit C [Planctomycetota bacterium]MDP6761492.1 benzoyl-CoA reductase subunit C [Planctomycetota bacterium]